MLRYIWIGKDYIDQTRTKDKHDQIDDGTSMTLPQYPTQSLHEQHSCLTVLHFSALLVTPSMISPHGCPTPSMTLCCRIYKYKLELHMSEFEGCPPNFLDFLKVGRLDCIFVSKEWYNCYFLVIEPQGSFSWDSSKGVGVGEHVWYTDEHDGRPSLSRRSSSLVEKRDNVLSIFLAAS